MDDTQAKACQAVATAASRELRKQKQCGALQDPFDEPFVAIRAALIFAVAVITRTIDVTGRV